tara:strand:+ start:329 stop:556 length:228 start_codon:yes stop_codon:yes gene_type:complete
MKPKRICIYPKDIEVITGKGERYSRKVVQKIRIALAKEKHQPISYKEAADYLGLEPDMVFKVINNISIMDLENTG